MTLSFGLKDPLDCSVCWASAAAPLVGVHSASAS